MKKSIKKRYDLLKTFRWLARISSVLSIVVLLMFLLGEDFYVSKITLNQWIGFLFFPVGLVFGFVLGWKNDLFGGFVSILSLLGFYFIYGFLITGQIPKGFAFLVFSIPAFLFLVSGIYAYFAIGKLDKKVSSNTIRHQNQKLY